MFNNLFRKKSKSRVEALLEELLSRSAPSAPAAPAAPAVVEEAVVALQQRIEQLEQRIAALECADLSLDQREAARETAREVAEETLNGETFENLFDNLFDARMAHHNLIDEDHYGLIEDLDSALDEENVVRSLELEEAKEAIWEELRELRSKNNASPFDDRDTAVLESFCRFLTALKEE